RAPHAAGCRRPRGGRDAAARARAGDRCGRRLDRPGRGVAHPHAGGRGQRRLRHPAGRTGGRRPDRWRQGAGALQRHLAGLAGRVLGLLSVAELPRRLMLDFRDFFSRGFVFNRVDGALRFDDGLARSERMVIDGAAAEIHIRGSADLRAQTYDQVIEVQPRTGGLLTAVGALTAGPVGAAVGAVANAVFEKPLGRMGARTYHVTGPWKDPKVVVEGREPAAVPAAADAPPVPPAGDGP